MHCYRTLGNQMIPYVRAAVNADNRMLCKVSHGPDGSSFTGVGDKADY